MDDLLQHLIDFQEWDEKNKHMLFGNGYKDEKEHRARAYLKTKIEKEAIPHRHPLCDCQYYVSRAGQRILTQRCHFHKQLLNEKTLTE